MPMSAHAVPLKSDFAEWRNENIAASYRKELDKKSRQLHRKGTITFACVTDARSDPGHLRKDEGVSRTALRRRRSPAEPCLFRFLSGGCDRRPRIACTRIQPDARWLADRRRARASRTMAASS